jgi:hypothetical protein
VLPIDIRSEDDLLNALRARCDHLRISYESVDALSGVPAGNTAKALARPPFKHFSARSARNAPVVRTIRRSFFRKIGAKGSAAYAKKCHAERIRKRKISRINRANALKRWRRPRITEVEPGSA